MEGGRKGRVSLLGRFRGTAASPRAEALDNERPKRALSGTPASRRSALLGLLCVAVLLVLLSDRSLIGGDDGPQAVTRAPGDKSRADNVNVALAQAARVAAARGVGGGLSASPRSNREDPPQLVDAVAAASALAAALGTQPNTTPADLAAVVAAAAELAASLPGAGSNASAAKPAATLAAQPGLLTGNLALGAPDAPVPSLSPELLTAHSEPLAPRRLVLLLVAAVPASPQSSLLTLAWVRRAKALSLPCVVAVCAGSATMLRSHVAALADADACALAVAPECEPGSVAHGRWAAAAAVLSAGFDVLLSDPDVALLRAPTRYLDALMKTHPSLDLAAASDAPTGWHVHPGPTGFASAGAVVGANGSVYSHALLALPGAPLVGSVSAWRAAFPSHSGVASGWVARPEHSWREEAHGTPELLQRLGSEKYEFGLEDPANCSPHPASPELLLLRATTGGVALLGALRAALAATPAVSERLALNRLLRSAAQHCALAGTVPPPPAVSAERCGADSLLSSVANSTACLGLLAVTAFPSAFVYAVTRAHESHGGPKPFALRAAGVNGGDALATLREEGAMPDDANAALHNATFLSYDPVLPDALNASQPGGFSWIDGWRAVQQQAQQLRAGLALAATLGRTLLLPPLASACECSYFPVGADCVVAGHRTRLPFRAPTAHWLRPGALRQQHRLPGFKPMAQSHLNVTPCATGVTGCMPGGTAEALRTQLSSGAVWLHVQGDVRLLWQGFNDTAAEAAFNASLAGVLGAWCCLGADSHPDPAAVAAAPGVAVWKAPYAFDGEPVLVDAAAPGSAACGY